MSRSASYQARSPAAMSVPGRRPAVWYGLILAVFFLTGGAGLVYEVAWTRLLTSLFGASTPAIATVLAAYMVGLTLGSFLIGRAIDRRGDALVIYAALEAGIALYAVVLPWMVSETTGLYVLVYRHLQDAPVLLNALRFVHAFTLLLLPTFLMGGTLPVLIAFLSRSARATGGQVALLYGVNTLGAAVGCAVAGFLLIEVMGVRAATWSAAAVQFLVAATVLGARQRIQYARAAVQVEHEPAERQTSETGFFPKTRFLFLSPTFLALATIGYSGFAALALENLWSRLLTFFLGNTVYSFTVVLTTLLTGIALGSLLARRALRRVADPLRLLGFLQLSIGLTAILLLPVQWNLNAVRSAVLTLTGGVGWWQLTLGKFIMAVAALILPTLAMGASFPCAAQVAARAGMPRGRLVGNVYAVNALCGALGSVVAGFGLVHLLGVQSSILLMALVSTAVGGLLLALRAPSGRRRLLESGAIVVVAAVLFAVIRVERPLIAVAGVPQGFAPPYRLIDYREGADATVAVLEDAMGVRELSINGVSTAFTSSWDLRIHKLLAYLPLVLHPRPERVLIVGYGLGVTARSALNYPTVRHVDVAEISAEVMQVSPRFVAVNRGVLDDPRLQVILNDGKNHLLATDRRYDMISANAIHPGVAAGNSALYTVDFYQAAREHLTADGVICQWVPIHQLSTDDVRTLVRSFQVVFPHTTVWFTSNFVLLIASGGPKAIGTQDRLGLDLDEIAARLADLAVAADLAGLDDLAIAGVADLAGYFLMDEETVARYVDGAALNSDDHPIIEFSAPRSASLSEETNLANLRLLHQFGNPDAIPVVAGSGQQRAALERRMAANAEVLLGQIEAYAGRPHAANAHYLRGLALDPDNVDARYLAKRRAVLDGIDAYGRGDFAGAMESFGRALQLAPGYAEGWYRLAVTADRLGLPESLDYLERAVAFNPDSARWHVDLAGAYRRRGMVDRALNRLQMAVAIDPEYGEARVFLAMLYRQLGREAEAQAELAEAMRLQRRFGGGF